MKATELQQNIDIALTQAAAICSLAGEVAMHLDCRVALPDDALLNALWGARDLIERAAKDADALGDLAKLGEARQ